MLECILSNVANGASILTAVAAIYFFVERHTARKDRAGRLLAYLKMIVEKDQHDKARSIVHLMARLGMSQEHVLQAALDKDDEVFRSIRSGGKEDPIARDIMFRYDPKAAKNQDKNL